MDANCQALRLAEKFGQASVNRWNEGEKQRASDLATMSEFILCTLNERVQGACERLKLVEPIAKK
jgi:hypothetical protein